MNSYEIVSTMEQFTDEEKMRIDDLAAGKVENITNEDMQLYARWQTSVKLADERFKTEREARREEMSARIEDSRNIANASIEALNAQAELARARLKAVENGQV